MLDKQSQYNQAIDNMTYLVYHYPKPVQEVLAKHHVFFQGKPTKAQLINEVIDLLKTNDAAFSKALETLIGQASSQDNDMFFGALAKGAVGLIGGLFKKKKRRRSGGGAGNQAALQARMAAQAAAAKRDMERRMQQMREAQERSRREAEERQRQEQERRRREAEAKKKTNMMFLIGGGVVVLGLGAVLLMKSNRPPMPYAPSPMQMPR